MTDETDEKVEKLAKRLYYSYEDTFVAWDDQDETEKKPSRDFAHEIIALLGEDTLPMFKMLKFFAKSVNAERIDLGKLGWSDSPRDAGRGYVRGYLARNYGIRITPEAVAEDVDKAILYMLHDALSEQQKQKWDSFKPQKESLQEARARFRKEYPEEVDLQTVLARQYPFCLESWKTWRVFLKGAGFKGDEPFVEVEG